MNFPIFQILEPTKTLIKLEVVHSTYAYMLCYCHDAFVKYFEMSLKPYPFQNPRGTTKKKTK